MYYRSRFKGVLTRLFLAALATAAMSAICTAQQLDRVAKQNSAEMLSNIKNVIQKNYYDPGYHGVNIDERFKLAEAKIKDAPTQSAAFAAIAQTLIDFND